jgi:transposase
MGRRGKRAVFTADIIDQAKALVSGLKHGDPTLAAVSVLMAGVLKLTSAQIASVLSVSIPTVVRMNERFRNSGKREARNWGGTRHEILPKEAEAEVLAGLEERAAKGEVVSAQQVRQAIEEKRGATVSLQTAYNVLRRQGWRKVRPDKAHPKSDMERQEDFKKKTSPTRWLWLPPRHTPQVGHCG